MRTIARLESLKADLLSNIANKEESSLALEGQKLTSGRGCKHKKKKGKETDNSDGEEYANQKCIHCSKCHIGVCCLKNASSGKRGNRKSAGIYEQVVKKKKNTL